MERILKVTGYAGIHCAEYHNRDMTVQGRTYDEKVYGKAGVSYWKADIADDGTVTLKKQVKQRAW